MNRFINHILLILALFLSGTVDAKVQPEMKFRKLDANDGLSNSQVNCIMKDSEGFMWFATPYGLNRYDGFRFKTFFKDQKDTTSVSENFIDNIQEAYDGKLWIKQNTTYSVYNPRTESFNRSPKSLLLKINFKRNIDYVYIDRYKNFWIMSYGEGCYFYNPHTGHTYLFKIGKGSNKLPSGTISSFGEYKRSVVLTYNDGTMACLSGAGQKVLWINSDIKKLGGRNNMPYRNYIDSKCNFWIRSEKYIFIYSRYRHKWFTTLNEFLKSYGFEVPSSTILVKDVKEDNAGRIWIATDHRGLYILDVKNHTLFNYHNDKNEELSIADNTQQCLYLDDLGRMWIGTYKNGVNMYSESMSHFKNLSLGDINTILEDKSGNLWLGTNDNGIICYNTVTGSRRVFDKTSNGFASNTIVSSYMAKDGSIWFGAYEGGLIHYKNGSFRNYLSENSSLVNDNVWAVTGDDKGFIWVGMIAGGVQRINPVTGKMTLLNAANSRLSSDYISSMTKDGHGNIIVGSSLYYSIINPKTLKIKSFTMPEGSATQSPSSSTVHTIMDSRGLMWMGTTSGMFVYDNMKKTITLLDKNNGLIGSVICSVAEDTYHNMWVVTERGISNISVTNDGKWQFMIHNYSYKDGLQVGPYNQRSIFKTRDGKILIGGQEGVDVINPSLISRHSMEETPLFSGLILYDHEVNVGENYNGRVILKEALNENRHLVLKHSESVFTILLSSNNSMIHNHTQFMYKLEGFNDKWIKTDEARPNIQFMSLAPGEYTLWVKVVKADGNPGKEVSKLEISIQPPFYASIYAYILYFLLIIAVIYYASRYTIRRQKEKFKIENMRLEAEKNHEIDEMRLRIFTNISHELRTPLTLIIAPLKQMIGQETDSGKRNKLTIVCRNAIQLLTLVNQLLDFRKNDLHKMKLNLCTGDIVKVIRNICNSFSLYCNKNIDFQFKSSVETLIMSFDEDKVCKMVENLVNNAFKFTPKDGKICVDLTFDENDAGKKFFKIIVSDTGIGISDENKKHVFERFYQVNDKGGQATGGSGVGLNLVYDFVIMHKGTIEITDNPVVGTVFIIKLPIILDDKAPVLNTNDTFSLEEVENRNVATEKQKEFAPQTNKKKKNYEVMVVDDSEDFLQFISEVLSEEYQVVLAHDGKEALERIEGHKPDVVLSDVMMPVMDGNQLCKAIKTNPETKAIPVIMLTARLAVEHEKESLETGADDYITKPFDIDLLNLRISKMIQWSHGAADRKLRPEIKNMEITSLDEKLVKDATAYVEKHLGDDISVETMSEALNMSRIHLYKKMIALTGTTPSEFIRRIRLEYSKQLLLKSQQTVAEVAYSVGFNSPRIFSKYFKEMFGVMPSQYKNKDKGTLPK